jgi:hypothetical protein
MSRLIIHPRRDTKDKDPVRTFMVVCDDGEAGDEALRSGAEPLHWEIRSCDEAVDGGAQQGAGKQMLATRDWQPLAVEGYQSVERNNSVIRLNTSALPHGNYEIRARYRCGQDPEQVSACATFSAAELASVKFLQFEGGVVECPPQPSLTEVTLSRTRVPPTPDEVLWIAIRSSTNQLRFNEYQNFIGPLFENWTEHHGPKARREARAGKQADLRSELSWLISNWGPYAYLRKATEVFVMTRCGVLPNSEPITPDQRVEEARFGHKLPDTFENMWDQYLTPLPTDGSKLARILPYLDIIRRKLGDVSTFRDSGLVEDQINLLQEKLVFPCMLELIWSYWMEEGMLVQTINAIAQRFQNVRSSGARDPLAQLEIDPLRPLNQLLWGFVQEETTRLSVLRRAHEYDHQYGFTLHGKALSELRTADRRSKFLESFHNLLWLCSKFFRLDDDTTVRADAFAVLNAIKETHYLLSHGAHNQFGDLPATARQEMLVQQYMLARPEMREFLGGRAMVPYPEPWMDRVDVVKNLKGWTDTSVVHFRDLATFGEQIVLSVRYGGWSLIDDPNSAANWARYWRAEIQGYLHAYRATTGVDLTAELTDQRQASDRYLPPSVHLKNRLLALSAR